MDKVKKIAKSDFCISAILTAVTFFICLLVSNFNVIYATNDDWGTELMAVKGYLTPFISCFLSMSIIKLQTVFTKVNIFILLQIILNAISMLVISYCFLKRFNKKHTAIFFVLLIDIVFAYTSFILLQFTQTATIVCTAGYLVIFTAFKAEKIKSKKIADYIIGVLLILTASLIRTECVYPVTLIFFIYALGDLYIYIHNQGFNKRTLTNALSKYIEVAAVCCVAFFIAFGAHCLSNHILDSSENLQGLRQYNTIRSQVEDYDIAPYENNEEFYNSIDIYSQNDLDVVRGWVIDEDFFTTERLSAISEYSSQYRSGTQGVLRACNAVYEMVSRYVSVFSFQGFFITLILCGIVGLVILWIFRNKLKFVFPFIVLLSFFVYVTLRANAPILLIPVATIAFITSLFFNRRHFVCVAGIYGVVLSLIFYMSLTRISFRTVHTCCFPAVICMLFLIDKTNLQKWIVGIDKKRVKTILSTASAVVLTAICIYTAYMVPYTVLGESSRSQNEALNEIIENDPHRLYITDVASGVLIAMGNVESPLKVPYRYDNVLNFGSMVGSEYFNSVKDSFGVNHLFSDMINNDSVYYVVSTEKTKKMDKMEQYFNDHYTNEDEQIMFEVVKEVEGAYVFRVVKKLT